MLNFNNFFSQGVNSTLRIKQGTNWAYKGQWVQVFDDTEIDRWYVGDFSSASYQITVEFGSNKKEILNALVVARPDEASVVIYGRVSIDDSLISLSATVNNSYLSLKASPADASFSGAKLICLATYAETINELTNPTSLTYLPSNDPELDPLTGGSFGSGSGTTVSSIVNLNDLVDVVITNPVADQLLSYNGSSWINVTADYATNAELSNYATSAELSDYAPINDPTFTGTVSGITAAMVGLGNVTNESKAAMFNNPVFTGTVSGITKADLGLGNVDNQSKSEMFTNPIFTGTAIFDTINLGSGATVTEFSTDATLSSASSSKVPTESAIKSYIDNAVSLITINSNNTNLTGTTTIQQTSEILNTKTSATSVVEHDFSTGAIWYHSSISSSFTANFTNVPLTNNRTNVATLVLIQGATPYAVTAVQINGAAQTVNWLQASVPTPTANRKEIYSFALIRAGSAWTVVGSLSTYG
jgi:hypothetical protein